MPHVALQPLLISQLLFLTRYYRELLHTRKLLLVELVTHVAVAGLTPEHGFAAHLPVPAMFPARRRRSRIDHPLLSAAVLSTSGMLALARWLSRWKQPFSFFCYYPRLGQF